VCEVFILEEKLINKLLILCEENQKKPHFNPYISNPGVKKPINTVNIPKHPSISTPGMIISLVRGLN